MALSPITPTASGSEAFGLDFQALLRIILTQLTYQDPLKPVDNAQFVSQLAQFSQLQQTQTLNDQVSGLLASQGASQAVGLLGRTVDFRTAQGGDSSGEVSAVSFADGQPTVTVQGGQGTGTTSGVSIADIYNVRP